MKSNCSKCKKVFYKSDLMTARNAKGERPVTEKAKKYCASCEQQVYEKAVLVDIFDDTFMKLNYYKKTDKNVRSRYIGLIKTLILRLESDGYTITQIRIILEYMMNKKNIEFNEEILLLVPYYLAEVSKYYNDLYRIETSKSYGYIPPSKNVEDNRPVHRPNRKAIKVTNMELV